MDLSHTWKEHALKLAADQKLRLHRRTVHPLSRDTEVSTSFRGVLAPRVQHLEAAQCLELAGGGQNGVFLSISNVLNYLPSRELGRDFVA